MKYLFESIIEKQEKGYIASIPFNVWEVCKQRDEILAEIMLDNETVPCKLIPMEKGKYEIYLEEDAAENLTVGVPHKFLLHVSGTLVKMDENSPYNFENPIRKIDGINLIVQSGDGLCGQSCVAMLAGVTIDDVINVMNCREWQGTMGRLISALNYYGIAHSEVLIYPNEAEEVVLPKCCIMMEKLGRFSHYLIHYDGKFYDPNVGMIDEYDFSKLLGYLEIFVD